MFAYGVLYTAHKTKKAKTWHDGTLRPNLAGNRAILRSASNEVLDSVVTSASALHVGLELESDKYLIQIDHEEAIPPQGYAAAAASTPPSLHELPSDALRPAPGPALETLRPRPVAAGLRRVPGRTFVPPSPSYHAAAAAAADVASATAMPPRALVPVPPAPPVPGRSALQVLSLFSGKALPEPAVTEATEPAPPVPVAPALDMDVPAAAPPPPSKPVRALGGGVARSMRPVLKPQTPGVSGFASARTVAADGQENTDTTNDDEDEEAGGRGSSKLPAWKKRRLAGERRGRPSGDDDGDDDDGDQGRRGRGARGGSAHSYAQAPPSSSGGGGRSGPYRGGGGGRGSSFARGPSGGSGSSSNSSYGSSGSSYSSSSSRGGDGLTNRTPAELGVGLARYPPLVFPSEMACSDKKGRMRRKAQLPTTFAGFADYQAALSEAVHECIQIEITELAMRYWTLRREVEGRMASGSVEEERFLRSKGIDAYFGCTLTAGSDRFTARSSGARVFRLSIARKQHSSKYTKDDLWVISSSPRMTDDYTVFARSTFYGPSGDGNVELELLWCTPELQRRLELLPSLAALLLREGNTEAVMKETLDRDVLPMPLLPFLLDPVRARAPTALDQLTRPAGILPDVDAAGLLELAASICTSCHLNTDQTGVLTAFAKTFTSANATGPVTLVHGVFGAGKSYLLAAIALFLIRASPLFAAHGGKMKVLVASSTNVAVDRVLLALQALDVTDFARVGSLRKISKPLLPFVANGRKSEDSKELQEMLRAGGLSAEDESLVKRALDNLKKQESLEVIKKATVVGVTCSASTFPVLDGSVFPVVMLDECSQMVEPLSLVPVARFQCARLLLIGDPLQLPPTLPGNSGVTNGLDRTLFERLHDAGQPTTLLGIQYRCHPAIMAVCNRLFYAGRVQTGVTEDDRAALVTGLPAVTIVDVADCQEAYGTGSFYNDGEASVIVATIVRLLDLGLPPVALGVIALYKAQVERVQAQLKEASAQAAAVQVSTVDAFQGAEREIMLLSSVRSRVQPNEFVDSARRINVAISRARRHLIVVGHVGMLRRNQTWGEVVRHCSQNNNPQAYAVVSRRAFVDGAAQWGLTPAWRALEASGISTDSDDFDDGDAAFLEAAAAAVVDDRSDLDL